MFNADDNGFQITFANGWTVSVQWRPGTYSSQRHGRQHTAEVAAFTEAGTRTVWGDVRGWQTPEQVADYIAEVVAREPYQAYQPEGEEV